MLVSLYLDSHHPPPPFLLSIFFVACFSINKSLIIPSEIMIFKRITWREEEGECGWNAVLLWVAVREAYFILITPPPQKKNSIKRCEAFWIMSLVLCLLVSRLSLKVTAINHNNAKLKILIEILLTYHVYYKLYSEDIFIRIQVFLHNGLFDWIQLISSKLQIPECESTRKV